MSKVAVIVFPGSNCDMDLFEAVKGTEGLEPTYVDYRETDLDDYEAIFLPGGFSYGDYLRTGAIARFAPAMTTIIEKAKEGLPVFGTCNGFQSHLIECFHFLDGVAVKRYRLLAYGIADVAC